MQRAFAILVLITALLNGGCGIIDKERYNRGGYLDYIADEHWFKADSKKMRALRAFALQASLARIASIAPKNAEARALLAIRIGKTTESANLVLDCAFTGSKIPVALGEPCFYFDSLMVDYTNALIDLAIISFPVEDTKRLLDLVTSPIVGGPVAAIDALRALINLGKEAVKYGRVLAAIYRDTVELEVQIWLATPQVDQTPIHPLYQITKGDVEPLQLVYTRGNDDMVAWQAQIAALRSQGLEPVPDIKFIYEISALIFHICGLITAERLYLDACQKPLPKPPGVTTLASLTSSKLFKATSPLLWRR
jgi:hypothetical protein